MLEVGVGLVPLVDANKGGQFLTKVRALRKHLATQLGFLVPSIHITDNLSIKDLEYVVYLRGVEITRWEMRRDCLLAISSQPTPPALARCRHSRSRFRRTREVDHKRPAGSGLGGRLRSGRSDCRARNTSGRNHPTECA